MDTIDMMFICDKKHFLLSLVVLKRWTAPPPPSHLPLSLSVLMATGLTDAKCEETEAPLKLWLPCSREVVIPLH